MSTTTSSVSAAGHINSIAETSPATAIEYDRAFINIFALLRELNRLLQQMVGSHYQQKALQSLYQFTLTLAIAQNTRNIGFHKNVSSFLPIVSLAAIAGAKYKSPISQLITPYNFNQISHSVSSALTILPQYLITQYEATNKEIEAHVQSTNQVLDNISRQLDQLTQMAKDAIVQYLKEIQHSHHQANAALTRL